MTDFKAVQEAVMNQTGVSEQVALQSLVEYYQYEEDIRHKGTIFPFTLLSSWFDHLSLHSEKVKSALD